MFLVYVLVAVTIEGQKSLADHQHKGVEHSYWKEWVHKSVCAEALAADGIVFLLSDRGSVTLIVSGELTTLSSATGHPSGQLTTF